MSRTVDGFVRHIEACNNTALPGGRSALRLRGQAIGWVAAELAERLPHYGLERAADAGFDLREAGALDRTAQALARDGHIKARGEAFDLLAIPDGPSLGTIDRGALPPFGLLASGVHLNGLVELPDGLALWVGRRARDKALDPGKLDHLAAGGVPAGLSAEDTLVKEGAEECGLPAESARHARKVASLSYCMQRPEGLRRDRLICFDLMLSPDWVPVPHDGEVAEFRLMRLGEVFETVRDGDAFKFNVNLVLIDLFLRLGWIDPDSAAGRQLAAGLRGPQ